jgi:hypothetical protein
MKLRSLALLLAVPWVFTAIYFGAVAMLANLRMMRTPDEAANLWMFAMAVVAVASVITAVNIPIEDGGVARLGLTLIVIVNLIVATAVSAGVGFVLAVGLFGPSS